MTVSAQALVMLYDVIWIGPNTSRDEPCQKFLIDTLNLLIARLNITLAMSVIFNASEPKIKKIAEFKF